MAVKTTAAAFGILFSAFISLSSAFMDIEELQSVNYGIDILSEPTVLAEKLPDSAILVTSRHGQRYQCTYPSHTEQQKQKEEEEEIAMKTGVTELLKPMERQACLLKTKDWWTYELCYGRHIRQYHVEEGKIRGNIIYLGQYESDFDWNNETLRESRVRSKVASSRYHSQYYTNGSKCDLTGSGRRAEVRVSCEEGSEDYLARVDEPETCVYILTVYSSRICKHPLLKSLKPSQPIPISCAPLLSQDEYRQYQIHIEAVRKAEEEAKAKAKAERERLERAKEDENIQNDLASSVENILKKALENDMPFPGKPAQKKTETTSTHGWKVIKEIRDLEELDTLLDPQGILSSVSYAKDQTEKPQAPHTEARDQGDIPSSSVSEASYEEEDKEEDDVDIIDEYFKEVERLKEKHAMSHSRLQNIKQRVQKVVSSQFKDMIEETEAEYGEEMDEEYALKHLADNLNVLLKKLELTEKEMKDIDDEIESIEATKDEENKERQKSEREGKKEEGEESMVQAPPTTRHVDSKVTAGRDDDGRWKVRVRTVTDTAAAAQDQNTDPQQQMLESSVKDGLEKAGFNADNVKVHVKIIGAKYTDDDDDTIHVLSEEDSATFQNMIVAILGGNNEAEKEQERFSKLADNYNFVFDKDTFQKDTTLTSRDKSDNSAVSDATATQALHESEDLYQDSNTGASFDKSSDSTSEAKTKETDLGQKKEEL